MSGPIANGDREARRAGRRPPYLGREAAGVAHDHRRDLYRARLVTGQLRDQAMASREPFQVADLGLDSAALDALWNGLDRVDNHFWEEESFRRYMESREEALPAGTQRPWWRFWGTG